jgi:hypothetical protein
LLLQLIEQPIQIFFGRRVLDVFASVDRAAGLTVPILKGGAVA